MFRRPPKPLSMIINLAPMVDVMMCLIIFFLLGSTLVDQANRPVNLPYAQAGNQTRAEEIGTRVVVNVRNRGGDADEPEYVIVAWDFGGHSITSGDARPAGSGIVERSLSAPEIIEYLRLRAERAGDQLDDLRCVIRADRDVKYAAVEEVLRGCGLAKIRRIIYSVDPLGRGDEAGP